MDMCGALWSSEEGIRFTGTRVTDSCELDAGNQIWVPYKSNKYSFFFFLTFIFIYYILITVSALSVPPSLPPAPPTLFPLDQFPSEKEKASQGCPPKTP